jgi:hypothetical protein
MRHVARPGPALHHSAPAGSPVSFFRDEQSGSAPPSLALDPGAITQLTNESVVSQAERYVYGRTNAELAFVKRPLHSNGNSRKPRYRQRFAWDAYCAAARARWVGQVIAANATEAIEAAAVEFRTDIRKLIA